MTPQKPNPPSVMASDPSEASTAAPRQSPRVLRYVRRVLTQLHSRRLRRREQGQRPSQSIAPRRSAGNQSAIDAFSQGHSATAELALVGRLDRGVATADETVLLAGALAQRHAYVHAIDRLQSSPMIAARKLQIACETLRGRPSRARSLADSLHHEHNDQPSVATWLQVMEARARPQLASRPAAPMSREQSGSVVQQLAAELMTQLQLIPALVAAQVLRPRRDDIATLRGAIDLLSRDAEDDAAQRLICEAMARLALLAGDSDETRRWAHRGLRIDPFHAPLALMLSEVDDDVTLGPRTADVLARVAAANPTYPDVLAALIRREHRDGRTSLAQRRLDGWLARDPHNAIAAGVCEDLRGQRDVA